MSFNLEIDGKFKSTTAGHIDWYYGGGNEAWVDEATALNGIPSVVRSGKTIGIFESGGTDIVEYYWDPSDITDTGLIRKEVFTDVLKTKLDTLNDGYGISYTYSQLQSLKTASELIPGKTYVLGNYVTKYVIDNSVSNNILTRSTVIRTDVSGTYSSMYPNVGDSTVFPATSKVHVIKLSSGYSGTLTEWTGVDTSNNTTTIVTNSDGTFIEFLDPRFKQSGVGLEGTVFSFERSRYSTFSPGYVSDDINLKPVIRPEGVLNTDVHDGTSYMDMTPLENPSIQTESLVLVAISNSEFSRDALSLTYPGDRLEYDFNDDKALNDRGFMPIGGERTGYILRRYNENYDLPFDWRVKRFRRWDALTPINSTLGGRNLSSTSPSNKMVVDHLNGYLNNSTTDSLYRVSTFGSDVAGGLTSNKKYCSISLETKYLNYDINGSISNVSIIVPDSTKAKDYFAFDKSKCSEFKVRNFENSVVLDLPSYLEVRTSLNIESLKNSTILGSISNNINGEEGNYSDLTIESLTAFSNLELSSDINSDVSKLKNLLILASGIILARNSIIQNSIFGCTSSVNSSIQQVLGGSNISNNLQTSFNHSFKNSYVTESSFSLNEEVHGYEYLNSNISKCNIAGISNEAVETSGRFRSIVFDSLRLENYNMIFARRCKNVRLKDILSIEPSKVRYMHGTSSVLTELVGVDILLSTEDKSMYYQSINFNLGSSEWNLLQSRE